MIPTLMIVWSPSTGLASLRCKEITQHRLNRLKENLGGVIKESEYEDWDNTEDRIFPKGFTPQETIWFVDAEEEEDDIFVSDDDEDSSEEVKEKEGSSSDAEGEEDSEGDESEDDDAEGDEDESSVVEELEGPSDVDDVENDVEDEE